MPEPRLCACGRELEDGEAKCPACRNQNAEWWANLGKGVLAVGGLVLTVGLAVFGLGGFRRKP